jgi:anaerobic selenocysteine-containing dehydrogenase
LADLAERFDMRDAFTNGGMTHDDWVKYLYENNFSEAYGIEMPTWDEILEQGVFKLPVDPSVGLKAFRDDPEANALGTPSGKIEIYSEQLAALNDEWELEYEDEPIQPLPIFNPGFHGYGSVTDEYPLYCTGFHHKSRTHSSYGFIRELEQVARQQLWINPMDAEARGIAHGDQVIVTSPAGQIKIEAKVTSRIVPGTIAVPQGSWRKADMEGDRIDEGGCVNTLSVYHPTPYAKGNGPAHSMIAEVAKA